MANDVDLHPLPNAPGPHLPPLPLNNVLGGRTWRKYEGPDLPQLSSWQKGCSAAPIWPGGLMGPDVRCSAAWPAGSAQGLGRGCDVSSPLLSVVGWQFPTFYGWNAARSSHTCTSASCSLTPFCLMTSSPWALGDGDASAAARGLGSGGGGGGAGGGAKAGHGPSAGLGRPSPSCLLSGSTK